MAPAALAAVNAMALVACAAEPPVVYTFSGRDLVGVKQRIEVGEPAAVKALDLLRRRAHRQLSAGPFSVVDGAEVPPSGDKHDYVSQAPYWWPDPKQPGGLPYIRRDGRVNPESDDGDETRLERMCEAAWELSLAWQLTNDRRYADHSANLIRVWYLVPETRMNPRLPFGQFVPGRSVGRNEGILETRRMLRALDAAGMLADSPAWTVRDREALQAWFGEYLRWLRVSELGKEESAAENNHGTWYDVQVVAFALFVGDKELAEKAALRAKKRRIEDALDEKGRQIHELERTKALDYSLLNLEGLLTLASLAERVNVDLWNAKLDDGRSLRKALDWLEPFAAGRKEWPYKQITPFKAQQAAVVYRRAAIAYKRDDYAGVSLALRDAADEQTTILLELVYPLPQ